METNRFVKLVTVFRFVVEPAHLREFIVAVVSITRLGSYLMPEGNEFGEEIVQRFFILCSAFVDLPVNLFSFFAVGIFQVFGSLLQGEFLSIDGNHHGAGYLAILLLEDVDLRLQGDVFFPEQVDVFPDIPEVGEIRIVIQLGSEGGVYGFSVEQIAVRLHFRKDLEVEVVESLFEFLAGGIAGHADLSPAGIFIDHGFQFVDIGQPFFESFARFDGSVEQFFEPGFEAIPVGNREIVWNEIPGDLFDVSGVVHLSSSSLFRLCFVG